MTTIRILGSLFLILVLQSSHCFSQGKKSGLLADPYPGSVPAFNPDTGETRRIEDARNREFYSKDPLYKVQAFYTRALGPFESAGTGDSDVIHMIMGLGEVGKSVAPKGGEIGEGGDNFYGGAFAGVTLHGKPNSSNGKIDEVFDKLQKAYLARFQNGENIDLQSIATHLEDPELKKIEKQYDHLRWAHYQPTPGKRTDNVAGYQTTERVIFDKYFTSPEERRQKQIAELQQEVVRLTNEHRFEEAGKVGNRMAELAMPQDETKGQMENVMKCLQELDAAAYATVIGIDMHPSNWIIEPAKK